MLKIIGMLLPFLFFISEQAVEWQADTRYDFETIEQGKPQTHIFTFKNTQAEPIFIETIRTTCGCTAPSWSEEPILPDSTGSIKISYDAQKMGYFNKKIRVFFNHQRKAEHLFIEGFVE